MIIMGKKNNIYSVNESNNSEYVTSGEDNQQPVRKSSPDQKREQGGVRQIQREKWAK